MTEITTRLELTRQTAARQDQIEENIAEAQRIIAAVEAHPWRWLRNQRLLAESRRLIGENRRLLRLNDGIITANAIYLASGVPERTVPHA